MNSLIPPKEKKSSGQCCPEPMAPSGPEVYLSGKQVEAIFGKDRPKLGEVYESEFQFKVTSWRENEGKDGAETSASIQLIACESCEGATEEPTETGDGE